MGKYTAKKIAEWFLYYNRKQINDMDADFISNLKLQKLLYYAQGCFLGARNEALFDNPIVAWTHGPVIESIYYEYKSYGSGGINYVEKFENTIKEDDESLLIEVYNMFAQYSAWGLRNMTHEESPWKDTKQSEIISNEKIKDYFKEHYIA